MEELPPESLEASTWQQGLLMSLDRAMELVAAGGPVVALLLGLSVLALAIIMAKLWQFAIGGLGQRSKLEAIVTACRRGELDHALRIAQGLRGPAQDIFVPLLDGLRSGWEESRLREGSAVLLSDAGEELRRWMRPLEVIASLAPLIGLFGTVIGMIEAFARLEAAGSQVNPAILSGGIWVALLTTAVGLAVAIPTVIAFNWLERRIERFEHLVVTAIGSIFAFPHRAAPMPTPIDAEVGHRASLRQFPVASGR